MKSLALWFLPMHFPARMIKLRKALRFAQQGLADAAELDVNHKRYS